MIISNHSLYQCLKIIISKTIVPNSKYLILHEHRYIFTNTPRKRLYNNEFLCGEEKFRNIKEHSTCEARLINIRNKNTNCKTFPVMSNGPKVQKLYKNKFIISLLVINQKGISLCELNIGN